MTNGKHMIRSKSSIRYITQCLISNYKFILSLHHVTCSC